MLVSPTPPPSSSSSAVDGCKYIEHMASPLPMSIPKNPDDLIKPAVGGVERVLNAAAKNRDVKRVVMTSSSAAISGNKLFESWVFAAY